MSVTIHPALARVGRAEELDHICALLEQAGLSGAVITAVCEENTTPLIDTMEAAPGEPNETFWASLFLRDFSMKAS